ncbi:hypothetical protein ABZP36_011199 [Zizania latifolia]
MVGYDSGGRYYASDPYAGGRRQHDFPAPLDGLELQPSDTCPKNYVIFDQTYDRSRVMFHPSLANNVGNSGDYDNRCYGFDQDYAGKSAYYGVGDGGGEEDDVLSTGRTPAGCRGGGSAGYGVSTGASRSDCGGRWKLEAAGGERKKERMKKMMRTLKGIIPGGDQMDMDTPAVLDEAVRYLKSLKVEVKKLGVRASSR